MTRASFKAPRRSGVRSRSVRSSSISLRTNKPRFLGTGSGTTRPCNRCRRPRRRHELPFPPPCSRDPSALHMSRAIKTSTLTTSPAPSVSTILLRLVPTVLARGGPAAGGGITTTTKMNQIPGTNIVFEQITLLILHVVPLMMMMGLLLLPELNSLVSSTQHVGGCVVVVDGGEKRDNTDTKRGSRVERMRIGDDGVVAVVVVVDVVMMLLKMVVVVERGSRRHHEHAHLRRRNAGVVERW